ncbi:MULTISPECIES: DUF4238 domain-containing protein [Nocardiaceae]|uniref:DUF4238 domain-containing protein n=1 Tax=Nocardiaceae TaxID=85025 RepID=UPI0009E8216C|nr:MULTISPECIES: DUF4238 domain-containing protein [Rhodococcus]MDJ0408914.1 DUF4238 domain-containing protein [Rhodococcus fascians]
MTAGGAALDGRSRSYMDRLLETQNQPDPISRRHHYVPRTYLKRWGFGKLKRRIWNLDTITGEVRALSVNDVCVGENFYRVVGPDAQAHNRVESMFSVADMELARVQALFENLQDPDELEFDDLIGLGVTVAVQRMRTAQQRRLRLQHDAWLVAQNPKQFESMSDPMDPYRVAGIHTELLFNSMWQSADVMTTRSIEVWDDPEGRFWTCDTPVLVPFLNNKRPALMAAPYILWPVSPYRVVALTNAPSGEKAVIRQAAPKDRGLLKKSIEQGRERWIFAPPEQRDRLPKTKLFNRRTQMRLRCSQYTPQHKYLKPPGCCVEQAEGFSVGPDVVLCDRGLHSEAPAMCEYT